MPEQNDHLNDPQTEKAQRIASLIAKYLRGDITPREHDELDTWVGASDENMRIFEELTDEKKLQSALDWLNQAGTERTMKKIKSQLVFKKYYSPRPIFSKSWHYAAAACLIAIIGLTVFIVYQRTDQPSNKIILAAQPADLLPGTNDKAILTLDDGKTIILDQAQNGKLASQGSSDIIKQNGQLNYNTTAQASTALLFNTVTTPRGSNYALTLSDGTKIWLNAASSIRFPATFNGTERRIAITGEAYFEVASYKTQTGSKMPFIVELKDKDMTVEVLGTHFNINSYDDESQIKTTLLEGAVKVVSKGKASFLKPGQQAQVNTTGEIKTISDADLDYTMAWKNGLFRFRGTDLKTIMNQLSRWYDVDIEYAITNNPTFTGILKKDIPVSKVFKVLEESGEAHFQIEGKKIKVIP